jgi:hypothetical protein
MVLLAALLRRLAIVFATSFFTTLPSVEAQDLREKELDINRLIQEIFPILPEESNPEELFEFFFQLANEPLEINAVSSEQLAGLLLVNDQQINAFIDYRSRTGAFLSLYELQAIAGWDLPTIQKVLPFLTLEAKATSLAQALKDPNQHFFLSRFRRILEEQRGFTKIEPGERATNRYAGSPWQWYARYRYARTGSFSIGLTLEKDAGETWTWAPRRQIVGADFSSFHLQVMNRGKLKNLVVGDFQMQAGQGLVLGSGFSLGKGSEVIRTTYRSSIGIRPYTSVMEQGFLRGAALKYRALKYVEITAFYAHNRRDGTIAARGRTFDSEVITSFPTDGYHRTPTERNKQGNVLERNAALHLLYSPKTSGLQIGVTMLQTWYSLPIEKRDLPYNRFEFKGSHNSLLGLHGSYRLKSIHVFGETGRSKSGGTGTVAGAIVALGRRVDISVLARTYGRNFHSLYGNPFKESSRPINEKGIYSGIRYAPSRKWQHSAYIDLFRFPWKKYLTDTTSAGGGFLLHSAWRPTRAFKAHAAFQHEQKQRNNRGEGIGALPLAIVARTTAVLNFEWSRSMRYTLRTRIQGGRQKFGSEDASTGFAIAQDGTFRIKKLEFSGRLAVFKTDDYDSRQYLFEKDVLYAFSIPSFYDHGTRHYLMIRYDIIRPVRVWIRWSQTRYSRRESIGSALDEIIGNTRSEIKMQVMYRF